MNDREIDELMNRARVPHAPRPEALARIAGSIAADMRPVRPLPPRWVLVGGLLLICAAVSLCGAAVTGFFGFAKMDPLERASVFPILVLLGLVGATEFVSAMLPGSRRRLSSGALLAVTSLLLAALFALCFREYRVTHFVHAGVVCLSIGLLHSLPAGLLGWLLLRRGFAVNPISAGLAAGTLAGLAGVGMLELHCPNFEAAHVLVWHIAVLPASAELGALCGWIFGRGKTH